MTISGRFVMGWARIDRPLAHYAQDTGRAIVLTTFRIVTGRGTCASEDAGFCCARGSRYRNPPGGDHFERNGLRPALLTAQSYQFFHHVQSAADVTSQFMPTPRAACGFGIPPDNLQSSHTATLTETGCP